MRPTVRRYRQRKAKRERAEWLAEFEPGARDAFFRYVDVGQAVFLAAFQKTLGEGYSREAAAELLELVGAERRWRKLRTRDGLVVAIGPSRAVRSEDGGRVEAEA